MNDQSDNMLRDSEIKFQCRLLLMVISALPKELQKELVPIVENIVKIENDRLDKQNT